MGKWSKNRNRHVAERKHKWLLNLKKGYVSLIKREVHFLNVMAYPFFSLTHWKKAKKLIIHSWQEYRKTGNSCCWKDNVVIICQNYDPTNSSSKIAFYRKKIIYSLINVCSMVNIEAFIETKTLELSKCPVIDWFKL